MYNLINVNTFVAWAGNAILLHIFKVLVDAQLEPIKFYTNFLEVEQLKAAAAKPGKSLPRSPVLPQTFWNALEAETSAREWHCITYALDAVPNRQEAVAIAGLHTNFVQGGQCNIETFFIHKAHYDKGLDERLLIRCLERAQELGAGHVTTDALVDPPMLRFFVKHGFRVQPAGTRRAHAVVVDPTDPIGSLASLRKAVHDRTTLTEDEQKAQTYLQSSEPLISKDEFVHRFGSVLATSGGAPCVWLTIELKGPT